MVRCYTLIVFMGIKLKREDLSLIFIHCLFFFYQAVIILAFMTVLPLFASCFTGHVSFTYMFIDVHVLMQNQDRLLGPHQSPAQNKACYLRNVLQSLE